MLLNVYEKIWQMEIRRWQPGEEASIWEVYSAATRRVVSQDYTPEQVARWAPEEPDWTAWAERLAQVNPFVAIVSGRVAGFAELEPDGHIDRFYTHPDFHRQGVGTALLEAILEAARSLGLQRLFAEVSTTGVDFFLARGFTMEEERRPLVCGAPAIQFLMSRRLDT